MEGLKDTQDQAAITIEAALERWMAKIRSAQTNANTISKYATVAKQILSWSRLKNLANMTQVTPDLLDEWICSWTPKAKTSRGQDRQDYRRPPPGDAEAVYEVLLEDALDPDRSR